ncbi:MAG: class E sortase [Candidatus Staskawiczbacteria bacterium]|nr:class E sortase [Candidatus Staskawiczbacteria bacterium]
MKINNKQKQLIKAYIIIFIMIVLVISWNNISWLFNYREMSVLISDFFSPYPESSIFVSADENLNSINKNIVANTRLANAEKFPHTGKSNSIQLPQIGIEAPIVIGQSTDNTILTKDLDKGTVLYPGSVLPGQSGQVVVLGHSAPPNWPKIKYDWVFSDLNNLNSGDKVIVNFNNRQYTYTIIKKEIVKKGSEVSIEEFDPKDNILTLISCWPPGKNYERIVVQAVLDVL